MNGGVPTYFDKLVDVMTGHSSGTYCVLTDPTNVAISFYASAITGIVYIGLAIGLLRLSRTAKSHTWYTVVYYMFGLFILSCGGYHLGKAIAMPAPLLTTYVVKLEAFMAGVSFSALLITGYFHKRIEAQFGRQDE